jgi:glycerol-3-phosphate cytidylyltransferase-like family protein
VSIALEKATPEWSVLTTEERVLMASSCRWVTDVALVDSGPAAAEQASFDEEGAAGLQARHRSYAAAFAAFEGGSLFDVEAVTRPEAAPLSTRLVMPTAGVLGYVSAAATLTGANAVPAETQTLTTVYVHGAFDTLAPGDLLFLKAARAMGDRLVVGLLSSDEVCRVISANDRVSKGLRPFKPFLTAVPSDHHFPVHSLAERAVAMLSLEHVDDVVMGAPACPDEAFLTANNVNIFAQDPRDHGQLFTMPAESTEAAERMGIMHGLSDPTVAAASTSKDVLTRVVSTHDAWLKAQA